MSIVFYLRQMFTIFYLYQMSHIGYQWATLFIVPYLTCTKSKNVRRCRFYCCSYNVREGYKRTRKAEQKSPFKRVTRTSSHCSGHVRTEEVFYRIPVGYSSVWHLWTFRSRETGSDDGEKKISSIHVWAYDRMKI